MYGTFSVSGGYVIEEFPADEDGYRDPEYWRIVDESMTYRPGDDVAVVEGVAYVLRCVWNQGYPGELIAGREV